MLLYADDIVMLADNRIQMQVLLDAVPGYSRRWRFEVNSKKTKVVVFGGSERVILS